jgi:hypothetical protein
LETFARAASSRSDIAAATRCARKSAPSASKAAFDEASLTAEIFAL